GANGCLSSASFAQKAQKQSRRGVGIEPDRIIPYKTIGDVTLSLHVFEPDIRKATPPFSAIVFFFGGGWRTGSPRQFYGQCQYLARRGMVAISAEYRIESTHGTSPFECIADAKSALRFLRANAESFKVDPNRIVASGGSAGGHIAACSGIIPGLESDGENLDISSVPNALVLFNPVVMLTDGKSNLIGKFSGRPLEASPHHFVREGLPPTIIFHGKEDRLIPYWTIEEFARKMQENGNVCQVVGFEGVGHGFFNEASSPDSPNQKTIRLTDEFLVSLGMIPSATRVLH
ncbi:MAG TPA: alpha/beta hydrolase, partial [bacterium]|nr:alpha/beta hydrolase [bacterium]